MSSAIKKVFGGAVGTKLFAAWMSMVPVNDANAQSADLAMANPHTKKHASANENMNQPVVHSFKGDGRAMGSSFDGKIAVHTFHSKHDKISGFRYARGLANGFANRDKTGDRPIYITSTHEDNLDIPNTYSVLYIDGVRWKFNGNDALSPGLIGQQAPKIMEEYVKEHGTQNLVPLDQQPVLVAGLN